MVSKIEKDTSQIKIIVNKGETPKAPRGRAVIRIGESIYDELVKVSSETNISLCELATEMLEFALGKIAVIERTDNIEKS